MKVFVGLVLILGLLVSCKGTQSSSQGSAPQLSNSSCNIGKWTTLGNGTLNLKISSEFAGDFVAQDFVGGLNPVEQVAKEWNQAIAGKSFFPVPMATAATTGFGSVAEFRDNELGIYKSHTWFTTVSSQALAITQFYGYVATSPSLGTYIDLTHADIILNYRDFGSSFTSHLASSFGNYDVPTVVLHEMGHFLGLCHETQHDSVMQPYYNSTQRTLKAYDKTKITDLYVNSVISPMMAKQTHNALSLPPGTPVSGMIELRSDGKCRHHVNGKIIYEH